MRPIPQMLELTRTAAPPLMLGGELAGGGDDDPGMLDLAVWGRRLARGWWVMALSMAVALGAAAVWLHGTAPVFESVATIRVEQERRPLVTSGVSSTGAEDIRALEMVKTIEQGLISQNNLRRVITRLRLAEDPGFSNDPSEYGLLRTLSRKTSAELRRGTRLIDVRVEDTDAERARQVAAAVVEEFIAASDQEARVAAQTKVSQLRDHVQRVEAALRDTDARIAAYRDTHRGLPLEEEASAPATKGRDLAARLAQVVSERTRLDAARQEIAALGPNPDVDAVLKVQGVPASDDITALKSTLAQKEAEFARLQQRYLFRHPKYIQAATELDTLRQQLGGLGAQAASTLAAAAAQLAATESRLRAQLAEAEEEALAVERVAGPLRLLYAQRSSDQASLEALHEQRQVAEVAAAASMSVLALADAPLTAARPSKPRRLLVLAASGLAGGVAGFGLVVIGALRRRGFDSVAEIERVVQAPVLAAVPASRVAARTSALLDHPGVERACGSSLRALRSALAVLPSRREVRAVVFVSGRTGEGSSFVAANHALGLARQGYRTLLIDGNLHAPALDRYFFESPNPDGLANFLQGSHGAGQACRPTRISGLYLLSAGQASHHPSEILRPEALRLLLTDASRWFHRVVIDAPAFDLAADGLVWAQAADLCVMVVDERSAHRGETAAAVRQIALAGVRPAGVVVNRCRRRSAAAVPQSAPALGAAGRWS